MRDIGPLSHWYEFLPNSWHVFHSETYGARMTGTWEGHIEHGAHARRTAEREGASEHGAGY